MSKQKCRVPGCRNDAQPGYLECRGCREHFESLERDGDWDGSDRDRCDRCGGDGVLDYDDAGPEVWGEDSPSEANHLVTCPDCGGTGNARP